MDIEDAPALRWSEIFTTHTVHEQDGGPQLVSSDVNDTQDAGACAQLRFRRTCLTFDCPDPSFYSALRDPKGFYPYSSRQVRLCTTIFLVHVS
jgi:hypothetical protein